MGDPVSRSYRFVYFILLGSYMGDGKMNASEYNSKVVVRAVVEEV
jgi:hypothetical protein